MVGYELYKKHSGTHAGLERISLNLMDKGHRFVMIETRNDVDDGTEKHLVCYQLHNHLGSANLELDGTARVISYEEYHPFGTTACQAKNAAIKSVSKRYRYTGMERDDESGLEYHSARYYLPWLGRWTSCDPLQSNISRADVSPFQYVTNNPLTRVDQLGLQDEPLIAPPRNAISTGKQQGGWTPPASNPSTPAQVTEPPDREVTSQQNLTPTQAAGGGAAKGDTQVEATIGISVSTADKNSENVEAAEKNKTTLSPVITLRHGLAQGNLLGTNYRLELGGTGGWTGNRTKLGTREANLGGSFTLHGGPKEGSGVGFFITGGSGEGGAVGSVTVAGTYERGERVEFSGNVVVGGTKEGEVGGQKVGPLGTGGVQVSATYKLGAGKQHSVTVETGVFRATPIFNTSSDTRGQSTQVGFGASYQFQEPGGRRIWGVGLYGRHEFDVKTGTSDSSTVPVPPMTTGTLTIGVSNLF